MAKFRKKPVVIEAQNYDGTNADRIFQWMDDSATSALALAAPSAYITSENKMAIPTPEGTITADVGDWVIRGIKGEFYPCKPDIFFATYEAA